jgi:Flp pilus assembly protein TadD
MSLLADLLSKRNNSNHQDKEIPPTLTMAQSAPASHRRSPKRYIAISVAVAVVAVGIITASKFERLLFLVAPKPIVTPPKPPEPPEPPKAKPVVASQSQPVTPVVPQPTEPVKSLEAEKPTLAINKQATIRGKRPKARKQLMSRDTATVPKVVAIKAVRQQKLRKPADSVVETVAAPKIDCATRDSFLYAARSAELVGDWRLALTNYRKAQKNDPDNFKIMNNVAAALNNLGMFDEGAMEAKRALGKKPDYVPAMINAAIAYSSTGNSLEALLLFSKASNADPTNRTLAINLGILQERTGKLDDAKATYRQLADAGDPLALHGMARIYERMGNRVEAVRAYRQIMSLPNASSALKKEAKSKITRLEE